MSVYLSQQCLNILPIFKIISTSGKDKYLHIYTGPSWTLVIKFGAQISSLYTLSLTCSKKYFKNMLYSSRILTVRLYKIFSSSLKKGN